MMRVIHMQNLPAEASIDNVRDFFEGFRVAEGGVHITSSYDGSVFVSFETEADAAAALRLDGRRICDEKIKLNLCSEDEKQERIRKLTEEDEILADCQEMDGITMDDKGTDKIRSSDVQTKPELEGHLRTAFQDNYIHVRNLDKHCKVSDLIRFFRGIKSAIPEEEVVILIDPSNEGRAVAFLRVTSRRAFEIALKMDEESMGKYRLMIMECSKEEYEEAAKSSRSKKKPSVDDNRKRHPTFKDQVNFAPEHPEEDVEYHLIVKNIAPHVRREHLAKLFKDKVKFKFISVRGDHQRKGKNEGLVVVKDKWELQIAMKTNNMWFEGEQLIATHSKRVLKHELVLEQRKANVAKGGHFLFLADLDDDVSLKDLRLLFGDELSEAIPRDGIVIRPDDRHQGYVAFVKFNDEASINKAKEILKSEVTLRDKKVYVATCNDALMKKYKVDFLMGIKSESSGGSKWHPVQRPSRAPEHSYQPVRYHNHQDGWHEHWHHDDYQDVHGKHRYSEPKSRNQEAIADIEFAFEAYRNSMNLSPEREHPRNGRNHSPERRDHRDGRNHSPGREHQRHRKDQSPDKGYHRDGRNYSPERGHKRGKRSHSAEREHQRNRRNHSPERGQAERDDYSRRSSHMGDISRRSSYTDDTSLKSYSNEAPRRYSDRDDITRPSYHDDRLRRSSYTEDSLRKSYSVDSSRSDSHATVSHSYEKMHPRRDSTPSYDNRLSPSSYSKDYVQYSSEKSTWDRQPQRSPSPQSDLSSHHNLNMRYFKEQERRQSPPHPSSMWDRRSTPSPRRSYNEDMNSSSKYATSRHRSPSPKSRSRSRSPLLSRRYTRSPSPDPSRYRKYSPPQKTMPSFSEIVNRISMSKPAPKPVELQPKSSAAASSSSHSGSSRTSSSNVGGKFIRVSPMPVWANDLWLIQFFSDINIKETSVLIKYNAGKPVHAYLECMSGLDMERACQKNGMYVGSERICVEPLESMM